MSITLAEAATIVSGTVLAARSSDEQLLSSITHDSRQVANGGLFACVRGEIADGHDFAQAAQERGASALLVDHQLDLGLPQIVVPDVRMCMGPLADQIFGCPSDDLVTVGVTGTSGKTTVVHLLESVLTSLGLEAESIGTLTGARTTPEAPVLQAQLADMVSRGVEAVAMEVSSHALVLGRVLGCRFDVAIFTNLGHDHLDFHHTMQAYLDAKASLFGHGYTKISIINRDDEAGRSLIDNWEGDPAKLRTYGMSDAVGYSAGGPQSEFFWHDEKVSLPLAGEHNVLNALAVASAAEALGYQPDQIASALGVVTAPPGRFEVLSVDEPFLVAVDYAHKPEALTASLRAARQVAVSGSKADGSVTEQRVIVVFGCGGDRDREKRPLMGAAAAAAADLVIVTTDNPRSEDPADIIQEIVAAIPDGTRLLIEENRRDAIAIALRSAGPGDLVLIAGKGHETYQEIAGERFDFDDRVVVRELLATFDRTRSATGQTSSVQMGPNGSNN